MFGKVTSVADSSDLMRDLTMRTLKTLVTIILLAAINNACHAQGLFGERDLGGSLSRRTRPGSAAASGT